MSVTQGNEAGRTRRDFLELGWRGLLALSGLLGAAAVTRFLGHASDPPRPTEFDLGPAGKYPPGSRTPIPEAAAILVHTGGEWRALSAECPHLGCTVEVAAEGFVCRCHGSRFDAQGALLKGPASSPLRVLRIEQASNGHLILHG